MPLITRLERKLGWIAIPGVVRVIMCFQLLVFILIQLQAATNDDGYPALLELLYLDRDKIMEGQVWRLVSFILIPPTLKYIILMIFAFFFTIFLGDMLESIWGSFRTTLYVLGGALCMVLAEFIAPGFGVYLLTESPGGLLLMASLIFACAIYNPQYSILLFGIIPIRLVWLALFDAGLILIDVLRGHPLLSVAILVALGNFWVAFVPGFRKSMKMRAETAVRRRKFEGAKLPEDEPLYRCAGCGKTDVDDPDSEFRVSTDGEEYCGECREKRDAEAG